MTKQSFGLAVIGFALTFAASPASAQTTCPIPSPFQVTCSPQGCSQTVTLYACNGYWSGETCGGPGCGGISCCGMEMGNKKIGSCSTQCAGCQPKDGNKSKLANRSQLSEATEKVAGLAQGTKASTTAGSASIAPGTAASGLPFEYGDLGSRPSGRQE